MQTCTTEMSQLFIETQSIVEWMYFFWTSFLYPCVYVVNHGLYDNKDGLSTTTMGRRSDGSLPGGNDNSLLRWLYGLSEHPPFGRYPPGQFTLELAMLPFCSAIEASTFISEIFLTFLSCTCMDPKAINIIRAPKRETA